MWVHAAARWYSWIRPPSRSRRSIRASSRLTGRVGRFGREQRESAVRALVVVMREIDAQHSLEVAAAEDQQPVKTLAADGANEAFGVGVCLWCPEWRLDHLDPFAAEDFVEGSGELAVAVVDQEPDPLEYAGEAQLRACWVTQAPVGLVVQPARWTRRLSSSMKKST